MKIRLSEGAGGNETKKLINDLILKNLGNDILNKLEDSATLGLTGQIAFTTDSFVISPLLFPGGDIGKLAVCGTVNDLAVMGAVPRWMSLSLIIEEGMPLNQLEKIIKSIALECNKGNINIVCGDTKVVEKGKGDQLFINTSGIGLIEKKTDLSLSNINEGDVIIVNGNIGEHEAAIFSLRKQLSISGNFKSDCTQLTSLAQCILKTGKEIHTMRDLTRGGLAAAVNEIGLATGLTLALDENKIPVSQHVRSFCQLLGMNPFELANEGKLIVILPEQNAGEALAAMKNHPDGKDAAIIGFVEKQGSFPAILETNLGVRIIFEMPRGERLPRIC